LGHQEVADGRGAVPFARLDVTGMSNCIPLAGGLQARLSCLLTLLSGVPPDAACYAVRAPEGTRCEVSVTYRLIAVRGNLVGVRAGLIAIGTRLDKF
jgi:hypothetical protein